MQYYTDALQTYQLWKVYHLLQIRNNLLIGDVFRVNIQRYEILLYTDALTQVIKFYSSNRICGETTNIIERILAMTAFYKKAKYKRKYKNASAID